MFRRTIRIMNLIDEALRDAVRLHDGQYRGAIPYAAHPISVMSTVVGYGVNDTSILVAALLHDVAEDCGERIADEEGQEPLDYITEHYGSEVRLIVEAVTNTDAPYAAHVNDAIMSSLGAFWVKYADFLDNAGSLALAPMSANRRGRLARKYVPLISSFLAAVDHWWFEGEVNDAARHRVRSEILRIEGDLERLIHPM